MKKYFIILAIMSVLFACSKYDDSELRGRVEKLETFCNQLNTNITSLQTIVEALQNKDYVKSVTPIYETNKVIGYTISFEKSGVITIYHGKDGLAGSTPSIGVRQDTDGIYYWTIDGKWMTNEDGDRIPSTGENGPEGTPGITPKFKIENNYWCVSYDNGANWEQLGQATGDKGDSVFEDVIIKEDNIQFILPDETSFIVPRIMGNEITVNVENILGNKAEFKGTISMPILGENDYSVGIIYSKNGLLPIDESVMLPITSVEDEIKFNITASNLEYATQYYYSYYIFKDGRYDIGSAKSFTTSLYKCEVKIPGTLQELISDEIKNKITGLEISGSINGTDIKFIRSLGEQDICKLNTLDLTNANIVEGGEPYARDLYTKNDVIGKFMFSSLRIKNIYIPSSVNLIEEFSFFDSMVNYVKLNSNVTKIGESAFLYCHNLKSIKIPGNIKEIDRQAFIYCICGHMKPDFPNAVSYNRFVELEQRVFFKLVFFPKLFAFGRCTGISFVDSTMIPVCHNLRRYANKVFKGVAADGKGTMGWCHGFKLHLLCNDRGEIITFCLTGANVDDRNPKVWKVLAKDLYGKVFADIGYISTKLFDSLFDDGIQLVHGIKMNMKNRLMSFYDKMMLRKRYIIETINDLSKTKHSSCIPDIVR